MNPKQQACPICQSKISSELHTLNSGQLVRCGECTLVYFSPLPTPGELEAFYNSASYRDYYSHSDMADSTFALQRYQHLDKVLKISEASLSSKGRLLDIGCGHGDFLEIAAAAGWDVTGTELSQEAVNRAPSSLQSSIHIGDIVNLDLSQSQYSLITMYHIIEHLLDPVQSLKRALDLLRPQGILFVETPNLGGLGARLRGKRWSNIIPPEHLLYFEGKSLRFALESAGFHSVKVFSSAPQSIASIAKLPKAAKASAAVIYQAVPALGMGALLQAIALRP
ncbi:MAG: class I SAM-dependent methyltransferase [Leptolyngbyaceae cyanobacterium SL_1_1]|nr:class I SAM-dependent methyltransferase [Leptolyngbyaceae cyanobacterium RM1_1_2]NJO11182.1 class I SAM-dependent methyltransferase [Leptolyngbyaceae cyanobacterium SL_1_1]